MNRLSRGRAFVVDGGGGSSRSCLAVTRALHAAGIGVVVGVAGCNELAARSRGATAVSVPPLSSGDFAPEIRRLMASNEIEVVFATSDLALVALDLPGAALVDKEYLNSRAEDLGIPMPRTRFFASVRHIDGDVGAGLELPVVVKPVVGSSPAVRVEAVEEFATLPLEMGSVAVQPFLRGELEAFAGVVRDGVLHAAVHQRYERTWPIDCGTASSAVTVAPDFGREAQVVELLADHRGVFQTQFLGGHLIDVNPRPYGSMPLALAAGCNLAELAWSLQNSGQYVPPGAPRRGQVGIRYRWIEGDLKHLARQAMASEMQPRELIRALVPAIGTAHSVMALSDPVPALLRARQLIEVLARRGAR